MTQFFIKCCPFIIVLSFAMSCVPQDISDGTKRGNQSQLREPENSAIEKTPAEKTPTERTAAGSAVAGSTAAGRTTAGRTTAESPVAGKTATENATAKKTLAFVSQFDLKLESFEKAHPQTKLILETIWPRLPEKIFIVTSSLTFADGRIFYFSNIFKSPKDDRNLAIMFAKDETDLILPRFLYRSKSDGGWRISPETLFSGPGQRQYSKGRGIHYTQETKPAEEIVKHLEASSLAITLSQVHYGFVQRLFEWDFFNDTCAVKDLDEIDDFKLNKKIKNIQKGVCTYDKEISAYKIEQDVELLKIIQDCSPSSGFSRIKTSSLTGEELEEARSHNKKDAKYFYDLMRDLKYPPQFLPFYSASIRTYQFTHTLFGKTTVEVLAGKLDGKDIEWHFARDQKGRIWIDRINFADREINSYGLLSTVIDSGLLTNKPLEYGDQTYLLWADDHIKGLTQEQIIRPFKDANGEHTNYYDLTPLLDSLKPIEEFRKARGIIRTH